MKIKEAIKKLIYPNKYCSEAYVNFLRRGGGGKDRRRNNLL